MAHIHVKIANAHADYLHKISTELVKNHELIGIEDLQISTMLKPPRLTKAISEVSWAQFQTMLDTKQPALFIVQTQASRRAECRAV